MAILIILLTFAVSLLAQAYVRSMFQKYGQIAGSGGYTGAEVAMEILRRNGVSGVAVEEREGFMGDHYDPVGRRVVLSSEVYRGNSLSALGVAAHEVGHALQHYHGYIPLHVRTLAVGATQFASQLVFWLPVLGMAGGLFQSKFAFTVMAAGWCVIMLFNLVTLPVEYDASSRGKEMLSRLGIVRSGDESRGVSIVLHAAALTYVAAFVTSLLYVLLYILPLLTGGRSRNDE